MKKYLLFLIILVMSFILFSCEKDSQPIDDVNDNVDVEEKCFYEVSFYIEDELYELKKVEKGNSVSKPNDPVKEGFSFNGWFTIDETEWYFNNQVTDKLSLYAKFTSIETPMEEVPSRIEIIGDEEMYIGYSQQLIVNVYPATASSAVKYVSSDENIATVDENGIVKAIGYGSVRINVKSTVDESIMDTILIQVLYFDEVYINMGGYEIVAIANKSQLSSLDPFNENYTGYDKTYYQQAIHDSELKYNCKIVFKSYDDMPSYSTASSNYDWLESNAKNNTSECDVAYLPCSLVENFAKKGVIERSGAKIISNETFDDTLLKVASTYKNLRYGVARGIELTNINIDLGLYYNYGMIKELGISDPATLFNEDKWNYTGFTKWVKEAKTKLGNKKVLGGDPFDFYCGLTNACGIRIVDYVFNEYNINSNESKDAMTLMQNLCNLGYVDTRVLNSERPAKDGNDFFDEGILMVTGHFSYINNKNRWSSDNGLNWGDNPEIGYVPFPYPDTMNKEDTRVNNCELSNYMFIAGRRYPNGIIVDTIDDILSYVFRLNYKYQMKDELFKPEEIVRYELSKLITNSASIEAIIYYYNSNRVIYDVAKKKTDKFDDEFRDALYDVMFNNSDFNIKMRELEQNN